MKLSMLTDSKIPMRQPPKLNPKKKRKDRELPPDTRVHDLRVPSYENARSGNAKHRKYLGDRSNPVPF